MLNNLKDMQDSYKEIENNCKMPEDIYKTIQGNIKPHDVKQETQSDPKQTL